MPSQTDAMEPSPIDALNERLSGLESKMEFLMRLGWSTAGGTLVMLITLFPFVFYMGGVISKVDKLADDFHQHEDSKWHDDAGIEHARSNERFSEILRRLESIENKVERQ